MSTKDRQPIDWLFPQVRKEVLALVLARPEERWHLRDIARQTGWAVAAVSRELSGLTEAEIVTKTRSGNRTYYQANRDCPFLPELSSLIQKTAGVHVVLREALEPLADRIAVAFIYGSIAGEKQKAASDIDLMVVGDVEFGQVVERLEGLEDRLGREVNPTVFPIEEIRHKLAAGDHFIQTVWSGPRSMLIGNERELERLAG